MVVRIYTNERIGGASAFPAAAPFDPVPTAQDGADRQLDIALGRADRARAQSASALAFENILGESADQAPDDGSGIVEAVNIRLDQHIRDALEVYTDSGEREAMMDLLEGQAEPVRTRARDRQIEVRSGHLRHQVAGVTDDWAASARMNPAEAPMIAMRAAAAVHAVADNDDARVISAERIGDLVQATERKVLSAALSSLLDQDPDQVPALLAEPDGPYRQAFPEDYLEDARAEAEVRVRARAAEILARLERAIDEGAAGALELKQAAREDWLDEDAQARMQERLDTRAAEARSGRERILRVAGLVADGGSLDSSILEDREAADVYYESVVAPGLEALNPAERIGEAAGFAHRFGVLPKGARRQIRGGLAATEPAVRARAADAVVRLGETAPKLIQDFDPGLRTEAYLIASLVDSGVDAAPAVEVAGDALARNSAADRAERERRITEENHAAENGRFLTERWDGNAEGPTVPTVDLHAIFSEMVRSRFLRTGDLGAAQQNAFNDFWRDRFPRYPARDPDGNPFDPDLHLPPGIIDRPGWQPDPEDAEPRPLPELPQGGQYGPPQTMEYKPGWIWENGGWRRETPEEADQRQFHPLSGGTKGGPPLTPEAAGPQLMASDGNSGGQGGGEGGGPADVGNGGEKGDGGEESGSKDEGKEIGGDEAENESGAGGKGSDKNAGDIETARRGELGSALKLVDRIQDQLARDPEAFDKLPPELRSFYTSYQEHVRSSLMPPTEDKGLLRERQRTALTYAREAMAAHHSGNALAQGALKTGSAAVQGVGALSGSEGINKAGKTLENNIEKAFPVPESLSNTDGVQDAKTAGKVAVTVAAGGAGLARGAIAKTAVGVFGATTAADEAAQEVANRGGSELEQRYAAFGAAAAEALGPKLTKIGAKEGKGLLKITWNVIPVR